MYPKQKSESQLMVTSILTQLLQISPKIAKNLKKLLPGSKQNATFCLFEIEKSNVEDGLKRNFFGVPCSESSGIGGKKTFEVLEKIEI